MEPTWSYSQVNKTVRRPIVNVVRILSGGGPTSIQVEKGNPGVWKLPILAEGYNKGTGKAEDTRGKRSV